jgi:hypothetical protein
MSAESAFWDLYDRDERGCEAVYVRELEATIERLTGTLPPPVAALLNRAERAEAALAERDRMLRLSLDILLTNDDPEAVEEYIEFLRARAEEGSRNE